MKASERSQKSQLQLKTHSSSGQKKDRENDKERGREIEQVREVLEREGERGRVVDSAQMTVGSQSTLKHFELYSTNSHTHTGSYSVCKTNCEHFLQTTTAITIITTTQLVSE